MTTVQPLLLTLGDPAGIGPELVARAFASGHLHDVVCVAHPDVVARGFAACGMALPVVRHSAHLGDLLEEPSSAAGGATDGSAGPDRYALRVWNPSSAGSEATAGPPPGGPVDWRTLPWGRIDARCGAEAARTVAAAVQALRGGWGRGLVTAPLHKEALALAGVPFPGHTEMLQAWASAQPEPVRMMLASPELKVVLVTIHLSLRRAIEAVTFEAVLETLRIAHRAAQSWGLSRPRIAVAGLNPHAGEGGLFGDEEIRIIGPSIDAARAEGIDASGPWPPDTVFMRARHTAQKPGAYDLVVAMTHDHGLIPVKYLGVEQGVNVTLGLPFVRTSPDHGTAFDIAGCGVADPGSLVSALEMARRLGGS